MSLQSKNSQSQPRTTARSTSTYQVAFVALLTVALATMAGCAQRPHLQVAKGIDPAYVDKNVRFRTTYYFRVVDLCDDGKNQDVIAIDSLYRYRMTGKASPSAVKVKFESGTLTAQQIDPFGAQVAFDKKSNRHYFLSAQETKARARREDIQLSIRDLLKLHQDISNQKRLDNPGIASIKSTLEREISALGALLREDSLPLSGNKLDPVLHSARRYKAEAQIQRVRRVSEVSSALNQLSNLSTHFTKLRTRQKALKAQEEALSKLETELKDTGISAEEKEKKTAEHQKQQALVAATKANIEHTRKSLYKSFRLSADRLALLDKTEKGQDSAWGDGKDLFDHAGKIAEILKDDAWNSADNSQLLTQEKEKIDTIIKPEEGKNSPSWASKLFETFTEQKRLVAAKKVVTDLEKDRVALSDGTQTVSASGSSNLSCGRNRRGFQILGPEGWRTFNQDERLLLAMTTSAQPLVQSLQSLSQRVADSKRPDANIAKLSVAQSRLQLSEFSLDMALNRQSDDTSADAVLIKKLKTIIDKHWPAKSADSGLTVATEREETQ